MQIENIDPAELMPADYNPRVMPEDQARALQRSLDRWGFVEPVVVNTRTGHIVGGHQRVTAALALALPSVPVVRVDLDDTDEKALNIALNKISGEWDEDKLGALLAELDDGGAADLTGFGSDELQGILDDLRPAAELSGDLDEVPEVPAEPITQPGDLWTLGEHRLLCGDSRNIEDMAKLMAGEKVNVAITSPPYASQRKYDETTAFKPVHPCEYVNWFEAVQDNVSRHLASDGSWFVNIKEHCDDGQRHLYVKDLTLAHARDWGWLFVDEFIWTHGGTPKAVQQRFKNGWEPIFQFARDRHKFRPDAVRHPTDNVPDWEGLHPNMEDVQQYGTTEGMRRKGVDSRRKKAVHKGNMSKVQVVPGSGQAINNAIKESANGFAYPSNVISAGKNREALGHSAAYPVLLPEFFIKAFTDKGDIVFDPFMGSGTTMVAAERLGRKSCGIEISPAYCDVAVTRWEKATGRKAERTPADG